MNWKLELDKKEKEFNLTKEVENVQSGSNSGVRSGGDNRRIGGGVHLPINKEINKVNSKGGKGSMISAEAAKGDIEKLIAEAKGVTLLSGATVLILKGILVAIKVILTCRTNTVRIADKLGIPRDSAEKKEVLPSIPPKE